MFVDTLGLLWRCFYSILFRGILTVLINCLVALSLCRCTVLSQQETPKLLWRTDRKRPFLQNNLLSHLQHLSLEAKLLDRPGKLIRIQRNVRKLPIITLYVNCFLCNVRELQTINFVRPGCQSRMQWNYYITVWMITLWLLRQPCRTCFPQITVLH